MTNEKLAEKLIEADYEAWRAYWTIERVRMLGTVQWTRTEAVARIAAVVNVLADEEM